MRSSSLLVVWTLWVREVVRFYRQPSRVIGAVGSPLIFWLLIGSGLGTSFRDQGQTGINHYAVYFFPGLLMMILMFTAIFSTISVIEDRKEGFLQGVLVSPASRLGVVLGKVLGGSTLAVTQCAVLLIACPFLGLDLTLGDYTLVLGLLCLNAVFLTSLGLILAWQFDSIQGFHAVMNLLLLPMWMLSGALFPSEGADSWIRILMMLNPLTYGMKALSIVMLSDSAAVTGQSIFFYVGILAVFTILVLSGCIYFASKRSEKNVI